MSRTNRIIIAAGLYASLAFSAAPPALIDYQGVLRSSADAPLTGTYDMVFRVFDAATGGSELLVDRHVDEGGLGVVVRAGLFSVVIGGGQVQDGSGPGSYATLDAVFRDYSGVWLEVQIAGETLAPRTRVLAAPYALNAANLDGHGPAFYLDTSSLSQVKTGPLTIAAPTSTTALSASGNGTGVAELGKGDRGIEAYGASAAGYFRATSHSGEALLASGEYGLLAYGSSAGGFFQNTLQPSTHVSIAEGTTALVASAVSFGGHFYASQGSEAIVANGQNGMAGYGELSGGYFRDTNDGAEAWIGFGLTGIESHGADSGGYFVDTNESGTARVAYGDRGIWARGSFAGGTFSHPNGTTFWADVATPTRKITGTGTVSFVQNHPYEPDKVIVYAAPEGDEVAVYTRGHARLEGGIARVELGATFALVANPEIGLTAHLTARGAPSELWVEELGTRELVVRGPAGSDAAFDFIVYGLRLGFEDAAIVQPKRREAFLPSTAAVAAEYGGLDARDGASAQARFVSMREAARLPAPAAGTAMRLATAVGRADPESANAGARRVGATNAEEPVSWTTDPPSAPAGTGAPAPPALPRFPVSEPVLPGELLALDPLRPGSLRRATMSDPLPVVGVAIEAGDVEVGLASCGIVALRVDGGPAPIAAGDALTSSAFPGVAVRVEGAPRAVVGIALEPWRAGIGTIRTLLSRP